METVPNKLEQINSKERLEELQATGNYLFHGSPFKVHTFEPRQAYTDIEGEPTPDGEPAVFASAEIETPLFRSIFHESSFTGLEGSYEVGFSNSDDGNHYIHANDAAIEVCKQNTGYVYVFKREDFLLRGNSEWVATEEVKPVAVFYSSFADIGLPIEPSRPENNREIQLESIIYPNIASEIKEMVEVDQAMRQRWDIDPYPTDEEMIIDKNHTNRMKKIVEEIGWPTASKVGAETASGAWLLVQHADHDPDFQEHCLYLMRQETNLEVDLSDMAYLEDRICVNRNRPQLYGTQGLNDDTGAWVTRPIEDKEHVDERRASVGLEPLAEYLVHMNEKYGKNS